MDVRTAAVVGLGLIGGSVARELAARGVRVLGADRDAACVRAAVEEGVVAAALGDGLEGIEEADLVVLAVPVAAAGEVLRDVARHAINARLVTDVGSTKRGAVAAAEAAGLGARFVGAHPLAGDHRSGWEASRVGLFDGAPVFLTPTSSTSADAMSLARGLWTAMGGRVNAMSAEEHDRALAWSSHLPQAVGTSLARALRSAGVPRDQLGPGGRDSTRLAGSSVEMWVGVALENADELSAALRAVEGEIASLRAALEAGEGRTVSRIFAEGREWFDGGTS